LKQDYGKLRGHARGDEIVWTFRGMMAKLATHHAGRDLHMFTFIT
jgi:hypothetical protein